jgi:ATP-binding cassette subfamily F protein 3
LGPNGRPIESKSKSTSAPSKSAAPALAASKPVPGKPIDKDLQKRQRRFEQVEKDLALLTEKKARLEADLGAPDVYSDKNKFALAEKAYQECNAQWKSLNKEYEELFEKMMEGGA